MVDRVIELRGRGARGAKGQKGDASGPLGANSVGSDEITNDQTKQAAMLHKIMYNGAPLDQTLAQVSDQSQAAVQSTQGGAWDRSDSIDFSTLYQPGEGPVREVRTIGTPNVAIGSLSDLVVISDLTDGTKRALINDVRFAEGVLRVQMRRGADAASSRFAIHIQDANGDSRAFGSSDGTTLRYDLIGADAAVTPLVAATNAYVGNAGDLVWTELRTEGLFAGRKFDIRSWVDGGSRPSDGQAASGTYPASAVGANNAVGRRLNDGRLRVSTYASVPAILRRVQSHDGRRGTRLLGQVAAIGRWCSRYYAGDLCWWTSRSGSKVRSLLTGSADWQIEYVGNVDGQAPVLDVFVNGVRYGNPVSLNGTPGAVNTATLVSGLSPKVVSRVEVRVRGIDVFSNMWYLGAGLMLRRLVPVTSGGLATPWNDTRPKVLIVGDSIPQGSVARGDVNGNPLYYGGDVAWPILAGEQAGLQIVMNAFGGTGVTVANTGGTQPSAMLNAFNFMAGRPIEPNSENIKLIIVAHGTNDKIQGVSEDTFKAQYKILLMRLLNAHPEAKILAMVPLNQSYAVSIFNALGDLGDPRIALVNTTGGAWANVTYNADNVHPDVPGHQVIAGIMAPVMLNAVNAALI